MNKLKWIVPSNLDNVSTGYTHGNTKTHIFDTESGKALCNKYHYHVVALLEADEVDNFDKKYTCKACLRKASPEGEMFCIRCGCTWLNACQGGCYWVKDGLCSACATNKELREFRKEANLHE